jgi:hypothetical protein
MAAINFRRIAMRRCNATVGIRVKMANGLSLNFMRQDSADENSPNFAVNR